MNPVEPITARQVGELARLLEERGAGRREFQLLVEQPSSLLSLVKTGKAAKVSTDEEGCSYIDEGYIEEISGGVWSISGENTYVGCISGPAEIYWIGRSAHVGSILGDVHIHTIGSSDGDGPQINMIGAEDVPGTVRIDEIYDAQVKFFGPTVICSIPGFLQYGAESFNSWVKVLNGYERITFQPKGYFDHLYK